MSTALPVDRQKPDESSRRYAGWRVVATCFLLALFCWGFGFYGHGLYLVELQRLHGWPASLISSATTLYYLFSALLVVFVSDAIARLGPRRFALLGILCLGGSTALLAVITAPWQLYAVYFLMAFGWAAMSTGAISNILGLWFDRRRGLAISLALNGASCGGIVVVPALVALIEASGFATALPLAVAIMLVILVPVSLLWLDRPAMASGRSATQPAAIPWTRARALRSLAFWGVSIPFALALLAQVGFLVHQIAFLEPTLGRVQAGMAVAVTTVMAVVGRLGLGTVIDRLDRRRATAASLASQALALAAMTQTSDPTALFVACAVFGFSVGNVITLPSLIIQHEFDRASFGALVGLSTAIGQFTYAFGPGVVGLLRDATGSYTLPLLLCAAVDGLAVAIILLRTRR